MSRIGNKIIEIPGGVKVEKSGLKVKVSGPLGNLEAGCHPSIAVKIEGSTITVTNERPADRACRQMHGTLRKIIFNMVAGVSKGFGKDMQLFGTGYSVNAKGDKLVLNVGFCHPVELAIPKGITVNIQTPATRGNDVPAKFTINGSDKALLGQFAADIRAIRPPEPYKGKGIRYADEHVRRKVGKAFASGSS